MRDYRLYCLDGVGKFTAAETILADSDNEAIELARTKKLEVKCELWERNRLVATIPAHDPSLPS